MFRARGCETDGEHFHFEPSGALSLSVVCDGWHHIAIVGNDNQLSYFIDGKPAGSMRMEPEPAVLRRHPETPLVRAFPKQRAAKFPQQQFSQLAEPAVTEAALAATKNWKEFRDAAEKLQE